MEAQRYPEDFDGIVAGAPAFSWPATGAKAIKECQTNYPNAKNSSEPIITADNLKLLQEIVLRQCDKLDGLNDNILNEPSKCHIDFTKLPICQGEISGKDCFTKNQLVAIRAIYDPLTVNDKLIYPGFPFGLEAEPGGMDLWITGTSPFLKPSAHNYFGQGIFKYLVFNDPNWDYTKYDFENFFQETKYASSYLDATSIDYTGLKNRKGKMIMFHGWNDPAVSAYSTVQHYEGAMKLDKDLQSYIRLFLLPGVLHCAGGRGPDNIDWVKLIQDWVEKGNAPERVIFSKIVDGKVAITRPVYPYPKVATYSGKGDANQEKSFVLKDK
jgi:feruloyl esterase